MPKPDFVTEFLHHGLEPGTITPGLEADAYWFLELLVESAHCFFVLVLQFRNDEFAKFQFSNNGWFVVVHETHRRYILPP
jgi:hypothetical protein